MTGPKIGSQGPIRSSRRYDDEGCDVIYGEEVFLSYFSPAVVGRSDRRLLNWALAASSAA
ncbi:MAG: hypothetical protein QG602_4031 [Verrucomicrobiota bacterium]|nr:hypothetical protein [Verrucomicrobiota bacterium]